MKGEIHAKHALLTYFHSSISFYFRDFAQFHLIVRFIFVISLSFILSFVSFSWFLVILSLVLFSWFYRWFYFRDFVLFSWFRSVSSCTVMAHKWSNSIFQESGSANHWITHGDSPCNGDHWSFYSIIVTEMFNFIRNLQIRL